MYVNTIQSKQWIKIYPQINDVTRQNIRYYDGIYKICIELN